MYDDELHHDVNLLRDEFYSVYMHFDHLHAIARALYTSITVLVEACDAHEPHGFTATQRAHLRLALSDARESMRMAYETVEGETHAR